MIIRSRGYLPHIEEAKSTYFITYRLAGSMPAHLLELWKSERMDLEQRLKIRKATDFEIQELTRLYSDRIEKYLDSGAGECWLKNPAVAHIVSDNLEHFDGTRYQLHAWCIMPNHVHSVMTPISIQDSALIPILHSWKSYTALKANKILSRSGKFWQEEYYDHKIRSEEEFWFYIRYTLENPVSAGLCPHRDNWAWSGCAEKVRE